MIYNIFKKNKRKGKKQAKIKIIVDIQEKNSMILSYLIENKTEIETKSLKIGDYVVGDYLIERKAASDFISSMLSKRLLEQLKHLAKIKNKMIIIEGSFEIPEQGRFNPNSIRGQILSILNYNKIPIIFTKDSQETAKYLILLAKQQLKPIQDISLHFRKPATIKEQKQYVIESFPNIGPKTAEKLLRRFKTIKNIINATPEELEKEIGKKFENIVRLRD